MIGILGGMGTQAGLDFCNKLAILNRGKIDQEYPLFILTINQIYQDARSLLAYKLEIYQINLQIILVKKNIIEF
jgi:aspartate/glutamate racemase